MAGITGANITPVGIPASASRLTAASRAAGEAARGSIRRFSSSSSVVTLTIYLHQSFRGEPPQQVEIAHHERGFGHDRDRVMALGQHLEHARA